MAMFSVAGNWKAYIDNRAFDRLNYDIYLYRETEDGVRTVVIKEVDNGNIIFEEIRIDSRILKPVDIPPTFRLPREMASALVSALSDYGVKPPDDGKLAGLYEAQSKHLTDLQAVINALLKISPLITSETK